MGKAAKEIRVFTKGIISSVSLADTPDESCQFSLNIEPVTETGTLQGIPTDTNLYPDSTGSTFVNIQKMVMLDRGHTEDLFFYVSDEAASISSDYGLNYIKDWYGARDLGTEWSNVTCTFGVPCFQKHNKEVHIGFGPLSGDSTPKWMGYTKNRQYGRRVASGVLITDAELQSPDLGNGVYSMDKTIRIEPYLGDRPHSQFGTVTDNAGTGALNPNRWTEELGTDTWRYGCKIGEAYIYKIKTEIGTNDPAVAEFGITMSGLDAGKFIRSNMILDTQGKQFVISSITPSRKFKNCLWATSNMNNDLRVCLIDVNDYFNVHDPADELGQGVAEWLFKRDVTIISEHALNPGGIESPDGNVEEIPSGEWKVSDVLETFECDDTVHGASNPDLVYTTNANEHSYHGAGGALLTCRLWFQLYKEGGFVNKMFNCLTVEPFLYSADIFELEVGTLVDALSLTNETVPMRRCTGRTKAWKGDNRTFYAIDELWTFSNAQGPNWLASGSSGWDDIQNVDGGNLDADGYASYTIAMGWNMGFTDDDDGGVVHLKEHSLAWFYGKGGYWAYNNADGLTPEDINFKNGYGPHQVGVLCFSDSSWVYNGGALSATGVGGFENQAWCPSTAGETVELGIFIMLSNHDFNELGYMTIYSSEDDHDYTQDEADVGSTHAHDDHRYPSEALDIKKDRTLYRLHADIFSELEWDKIKNFTAIWNYAENDDGASHTTGSLMAFIAEGLQSDVTDEITDQTRVWQIEPRGWYADTAARVGEIQRVNPSDPVVGGVYIPDFIIENAGQCSISVDWNWWYPSSVTSYYDGLNEHGLNFFANATIGEHLSLMFFGSNDATQSNTEFWATVSPVAGGAVDTSIPLNYTAAKSQVELITDDATMIFTNGDTSLTDPHGFDNGTVYRYKMSFLYDGYQHSPLTMTTWRNEPSADLDTVNIEVNIPENIPLRVSDLLIWRANDVMDSYKLVSQISFKGGWSYDDEIEAWKRIILDKGQEVVGESYVARTNLPETVENMGIKYGLSAQINGYHIVGNCFHPLEKDMEFYLFKSELERFDMFNWTAGGRRIKLPNVPTALAAFNGRVFAFDKSNIYTIDPSSFTILDTFEGIGCAGSEAVMVTEFGMCFADINNVYLHDGRNPTPVGNSIQTAKENKFGLDEVNLSTNTKISFDQKRGSFVIFTQQGQAGLYTEGEELTYMNLPGIPYIGYYHKDGEDNLFSGAYHTVESLKLMEISATAGDESSV